MPIPGVPPGVRRAVIEAFVGALEADPRLANRRVIKQWLKWDGEKPVAEPTVATMPAIQVRLLSGPVKRRAGTRAPGAPMTSFNESSLTVLIDLWTAGTDQGDLADVADLVYAALSPQDAGPRAVLNDRLAGAGIKDWQLVREILPESDHSFALAAIHGQGAYRITVFTAS